MGGWLAEGNTMTQTMLRYTAIVAVVVASCLEGCVTGASRRAVRRLDVPMRAAVTISNLTTLPVRIYLRRSSVDVALGTVLGLSSRTFEIDDRFVIDASELQLEARDRRGAALWSDRFTFGANRAATWQVGYHSTRVDVR